MTVDERIDKTVVLILAISRLWNGPLVGIHSVHYVDPRIFHLLPRESIYTYHQEYVAHAEALVQARGVFLRLYCGHNERCPLIRTH